MCFNVNTNTIFAHNVEFINSSHRSNRVMYRVMSVCAAPTCSHQSFDGSSYYVDVYVDVDAKHTSVED